MTETVGEEGLIVEIVESAVTNGVLLPPLLIVESIVVAVNCGVVEIIGVDIGTSGFVTNGTDKADNMVESTVVKAAGVEVGDVGEEEEIESTPIGTGMYGGVVVEPGSVLSIVNKAVLVPPALDACPSFETGFGEVVSAFGEGDGVVNITGGTRGAAVGVPLPDCAKIDEAAVKRSKRNKQKFMMY